MEPCSPRFGSSSGLLHGRNLAKKRAMQPDGGHGCCVHRSHRNRQLGRHSRALQRIEACTVPCGSRAPSCSSPTKVVNRQSAGEPTLRVRVAAVRCRGGERIAGCSRPCNCRKKVWYRNIHGRSRVIGVWYRQCSDLLGCSCLSAFRKQFSHASRFVVLGAPYELLASRADIKNLGKPWRTPDLIVPAVLRSNHWVPLPFSLGATDGFGVIWLPTIVGHSEFGCSKYTRLLPSEKGGGLNCHGTTRVYCCTLAKVQDRGRGSSAG